jgi:hypothetical protein
MGKRFNVLAQQSMSVPPSNVAQVVLQTIHLSVLRVRYLDVMARVRMTVQINLNVQEVNPVFPVRVSTTVRILMDVGQHRRPVIRSVVVSGPVVKTSTIALQILTVMQGHRVIILGVFNVLHPRALIVENRKVVGHRAVLIARRILSVESRVDSAVKMVTSVVDK